MISYRFLEVNTIDRVATAIIKVAGPVTHVSHIRITGTDFDWLERHMGLGHFMGETFYAY